MSPRPNSRCSKNGAPDHPYDGHTLGGVIDATEKLAGCAIERASVPVT